ncbi:ATP-binding protein [Streptomyces sp. NPDC088400]|uniref:ATP-binding protein n=1 Tax=Streptomyces sp. NPDC088400 TaxID=3365861 RepID=UPI00380E55F1
MNETTRPPVLRERFFRRDRRSIPAAREFTHWALVDWGLSVGTRADDALLCVSELATNALVHGVPPGRGFLLCMRYDGDVLRIEVHDSGGGVPEVGEATEADKDDEGGRGLLLVAAFADKWGVNERQPGKVVWCEFAVREDGDDEVLRAALMVYTDECLRIGVAPGDVLPGVGQV